MNVTFTYSYNHSIVPPRCRLPRTVREHDGLITVEIREIPPEQAPVAIISRNTSDQGHDPVEYRAFEGCLWTNCKLFAGARVTAEGLAQCECGWRGEECCKQLPSGNGRWFQRLYPMNSESRSPR